MKKALAILSALALVGSVAFAEAGVKVGAWGRGIFAFAGDTATNPGDTAATSDDKLEPGTVEGTSWGTAARVGVSINGNSDNVGFALDLNADGNWNSDMSLAMGPVTASIPQQYVTFGDNANIWVKPIDGLTLKIGKIKEDTLRGNGCFGSFDWIRITWTGEDLTFSRFDVTKGLVGTYTGVENLYVGFKLESGETAAKAFEHGQYAVGYTIPSIGQIRAQYIGGRITTNSLTKLVDGSGLINAAFKFTAVENLYVDVGTYLSLKTTSKTTVDLNPKVAGYVSYKLDALTIHALADAQIFTGDSAKLLSGDSKNPALEIGAGVNYDLGDGLGIAADVRAADLLDTDRTKDANTTSKIGGFAGLSKSFSNGKIGVGFEYVTKGGFAPGSFSNQDADKKKASWAIPVLFEYSF